MVNDPLTMEDVVTISSKLVHALNNSICALNGEQQIEWEDAPMYMREGLQLAIKHGFEHGVDPRKGHEDWMTSRIAEGWTLGPVKSIENKISPCLIPYDDLPYHQRVKDSVRAGVVEFFKTQYLKAKEDETGADDVLVP